MVGVMERSRRCLGAEPGDVSIESRATKLGLQPVFGCAPLGFCEERTLL
jgi:hypothetical protein